MLKGRGRSVLIRLVRESSLFMREQWGTDPPVRTIMTPLLLVPSFQEVRESVFALLPGHDIRWDGIVRYLGCAHMAPGSTLSWPLQKINPVLVQN